MSSPTSPIRSASRASLVFLSVLLAAACNASATPPIPTATSVGPSVPASTPTQSPTVGPSVPASASIIRSATPTVAPPTPASPAACATRVNAGVAPSDRLTKVAVASDIGVDKIVFTFGPSTGIPSGTKPTGELKPTSPPFSLAGSGADVKVAGHRFIAVTFRGMAIADEQGNPSYTGPDDIKPNALAVRELRLVDDFEGVVTWIVGVDGPGCIAVYRLTSPDRVVVAITQP